MFELPESKKSIDQNRWPFKVGEKEYWLPKAKFLTTRQSADIDENSGVGEALAAIAPNKATTEALLDMPLEHVEALFEAWQEDSGVNVGESDTSED